MGETSAHGRGDETVWRGEMTPSQIVHAVCGAHRVESCIASSGHCWLCAGTLTRGEPVDSWNGASFTGQNRVRCPNATHVCEACVFVCARLSPVPGRPPKEGKSFGGNFRNYSHLWERGASPEYANASKGEKSVIREFLARHHRGDWFAALADSGQKHTLPWAPMNGPGRGGLVLFDEQLVRLPESLALVDEMTMLLTAGATKDELGTGNYSARAWQLCGTSLHTFERAQSGERGGAWFGLSLWLAQRDEEAVQRRLAAEKEAKGAQRKRQGKTTHAHGRGAAGAARRVSSDAASERPETLGPASNTHAECVPDVRDSGGVGDVDGEKAPARDMRSRQRTLFD